MTYPKIIPVNYIKVSIVFFVFLNQPKNSKQGLCGIGAALCWRVWIYRIILSMLLYLLQSTWPDEETDWRMDMMLWQTGLPGKGLQICLQLVVNNRWCLWVYVFNLTPEVTDWTRVALPEEEREGRAGEERERRRGMTDDVRLGRWWVVRWTGTLRQPLVTRPISPRGYEWR